MLSQSTILRDWRLREVRLLFLALVVAVLSVTSISFFTDRVERAMRLQGTALLGADLIVSSSRPVSDQIKQLSSSLTTAQTTEFRSVVLVGEATLLVEVKAVSDGYPLRGAVETSNALGTLGKPTATTPKPGEAWAAPDVFYQLGLKPGDTIQLGESSLVLKRVISFEMDAGGSVFRFAPRLMIHLDVLPTTQLITSASRAQYKWLVAGSEAQATAIQPRLKAALAASETLQTVDEGRPEVSDALLRATRFMKLASVLTIIIAGAAVALSAMSFAQKEIRRIAVLKTLGATRWYLTQDYAKRFSVLILGATLVGSSLGYLAQHLLARLLSGWMNTELPATSPWPVSAGLLTAILTLLGFALPTLIRVVQTPPMRVMRAEQMPSNIIPSVLSIGVVMAGFLLWQAGELKLTAVVFAGVVGGLTLMLLCAWLLTWLIRRLSVSQGRGWQHGWQWGLANIGRYGGRAALLISTIGVGILALSLLGGVREDLISAWEGRIPADAPNHFLVNIQPADRAGLDQFLTQRQLPQYTLYPMIRGRLRAINETKVSADSFEEHRAKETLERELNLTTTLDLPKGNAIIAGKWLSSQPVEALPGVSVDSEIAEALGVGLNDTLEFDISGQAFKARVTSLRSIQWDTLQPNFYFIASAGSLDNYPATNITSVRIADSDTQFTTDLIRAYPHITVLDVRAILNQIQRIIAQVSSAVEVVFAFSLLAGVVVLLAAIQTQGNERRKEIAVLKTLGASKRQIRQSVATEFMLLGALAGLLGAGLALLTGWVLAEQVFDLDYHASAWPVVWGFMAGIVGLGGVGYGVIRKLVDTPPTRLLQEL